MASKHTVGVSTRRAHLLKFDGCKRTKCEQPLLRSDERLPSRPFSKARTGVPTAFCLASPVHAQNLTRLFLILDDGSNTSGGLAGFLNLSLFPLLFNLIPLKLYISQPLRIEYVLKLAPFVLSNILNLKQC